MKLVAMMPVHNEDWMLGLSLRVALRWCDAVAVLNHASTDRTPGVIADAVAEFPGRVHVITDPDPTWREMVHRQRLLAAARDLGASHCAIVDADEILTGNIDVESLRSAIDRLEPRCVMQLPGYYMRGSIHRYHANGVWGRRWFSMAFRDHPSLAWDGDQFHHREPLGCARFFDRPMEHGDGGVMHLWGTPERRLVAKHRLYKIIERVRWPDKPVGQIDRMYSLAIHGQWREHPNQWTYSKAPPGWWEPYEHWCHHLNLAAVPTQEAESLDLISKYGAEYFAGLDLFDNELVRNA